MTTAPTKETHRLDLGAAGSVTFALTFEPALVTARLDYPRGLARAPRRNALQWVRKITKRLDRDARPMRMLSRSGGRITSVGFELAGKIEVVFLP